MVRRSFFFLSVVSSLLFSNLSYASSQPVKDWTLIVFLNGNNDLDEFGPQNLNQMEQVGSTDSLNIVVQWASLKNGDTRRLYIEKDNNPSEVTSPVLENLSDLDMGDVKNLEGFLDWAVTHYPAKHYFVDIWNHGTGWHNRGYNGALFRDISEDEVHKTSIKTEALGSMLAQFSKRLGKKIDILGMDACLMAMAEVAAEVRSSAEVLVGSQDLEPGEGWPYEVFLKAWMQGSGMDSHAISSLLVEKYNEAYVDEEDRVTLSAVNLNKLEDVMQSVQGLQVYLSKLTDARWEKAVETIDNEVLRFDKKDYIDLGDMARKLQSVLPKRDVDVFTAVDSALSSYVIANQSNRSNEQASGVSIWFPHNESTFEKYGKRYAKLKFHVATNWGSLFSRLY